MPARKLEITADRPIAKRGPGRPKGKPRPKSGRKPGRPPGTVGRKKRAQARTVREAQRRGVTPLEFMLETLNNRKNTIERRMQAAVSAAPYCHAKLQSIQHTGKDGGPIDIAVRDARQNVQRKLDSIASRLAPEAGAGRVARKAKR